MANRIFVTGDTHGDFQKFSEIRFPEQHNLDKNDYVIICGDFGGIWDKLSGEEQDIGESRREFQNLDRLEGMPFTILFVDGNHENFDRLNAYPVEEWHGGKVHKIRPSIIHLMRGQVFEIGGKRIFTFGGAQSHDIDDGILELDDPYFYERKCFLDENRGMYRINHLSWWKEEMPSENEMEEGVENLARYNNEVDYIISHCCASQLLKKIDEEIEEENSLTKFFDAVRMNCSYKKWYFGHYHLDKNVTEKDILLNRLIIELGEPVNDKLPILGQPRYELFQPVKFKFKRKNEAVRELIGLVSIRDSYGTFTNPDEPSYDIKALMDEEICLFKHYPESVVEALSEDEIKEHSRLLLYLATNWK